nr:MAG TPA: hypothetical protein [Caudoviricetes sp.]
MLFLLINSCTVTPKHSAIWNNVSRLGWLVLVHHLETVA